MIPPPPPLTPSTAAVPRAENRRVVAELDAMDDLELDRLPYGVICLAPDGLILRYNAAEGRLARLDPSTVVGRNFFTDVAPCTNTPEFFGEFKGLIEDPTRQGVQFHYVFDFRFGAQDVDVEIERVPGAARYYLLVNRLELLEERPPEVARTPAPAQSELAAGETQRGIIRDAFAQRVVAVPAHALQALNAVAVRNDAEGWPQHAHDWGVDAGRRLVIELETTSFDDRDRDLRQRPMEEVAQAVDAVFRTQGIGRVVFDFSSSSSGALRVELADSAFVGGHKTGHRSCHMVAGMIEAVLSYLAGRRLHAEEYRCASAHDCTTCEIAVVGQSRREKVGALADRGLSFQELMEAVDGP